MSVSSYLLGIATGVVTTVFGSWVASKFHVYHQALAEHHAELKSSILSPIRTALREEFSDPAFLIEWKAHEYKPDARAEDDPTVSGLAVSGPAPILASQFGDPALYQDAARHHYSDLIRQWEHFVARWNGHLRDRSAWIDQMAEAIICESNMPPMESGRGVLPSHLALFICNRLRKRATAALAIETAYPQPDRGMLTDGSVGYASGTIKELEHLRGLVNRILVAEKGHSEAFDAEQSRLELARVALEGRFGDAITWRVPRACPRVSLRSFLWSV